jgi:hypothetical protein
MIFVILIQHRGILQTRVALVPQDRAQESGSYSFAMDYQFRRVPDGRCFDRIGQPSQGRIEVNESAWLAQAILRHFSADSALNDRPFWWAMCYSQGNGLVRFQRNQTAASRQCAWQAKPIRKPSLFSVSASIRLNQEFWN